MNREEWLKARKSGIGGSDVACVLGMNPWRTPLQLFLDKTGQGEPQKENEAIHFGTILEETVAQEFVRRTGKKVCKDEVMHREGQDGWQIANLDRVLVAEDAILECKTCNAFKADEWGDSQEDEIKNGNVVSEHKIPMYYETQVQWYLGVCKKPVAYLAVLIGGQDYRIYKINFAKELYDRLVEECSAFWFENVIKGVAPSPRNMADIKALHPDDDGEMVEATNEAVVEISKYKEINAKIKELSKELEEAKTAICARLGSNAGFLIAGKVAVTYKTVQRKAHTVAASASRMLRIY